VSRRAGPDPARLAEVARLHRARPRQRLARGTAALLALGAALAWLSGELEVRALFEPRRLENLARFVTEELVPEPLRGAHPAPGFVAALRATWEWASDALRARDGAALGATLALAVAASALAGLLGLLLAPLAAQSLGGGAGRLAPGAASGGLRERALRTLARGAAVGLRALPEYLVAFLLGALLQSPEWAAVLALALHNAGILGRLGAETLEDLPGRPLAALRGLGARRAQVLAVAALPLALPRLLLYFFYRFETCVRESTVLGLLGFVSLGYWVQDARSRLEYDTMCLLVGLGVVIVLCGDVCSSLARAAVRKAS